MFCSASKGSLTPMSAAVLGMSCIRPMAPLGETAWGLKAGLIAHYRPDQPGVDPMHPGVFFNQGAQATIRYLISPLRKIFRFHFGFQFAERGFKSGVIAQFPLLGGDFLFHRLGIRGNFQGCDNFGEVGRLSGRGSGRYSEGSQ